MKSQSPIELPEGVEGLPAGTDLGLGHQAFQPRIQEGATLKLLAPEDAPPGLELEGKGFRLVEAHYHFPAEHRLVRGGEVHQAAAEIHFVHRADDGALSVIGVMLDADDDAPRFAVVRTLADGAVLNPLDVIPDGPFYSYEGSLTTEPYTEGLQWFVASQVVRVSRADLEVLSEAGAGTARDVQPLHGRTVCCSKAAVGTAGSR